MVSATSTLLTVTVFAMLISVAEAEILCLIFEALYRVILACPGSGNGLCDLIHFLFHAINCPERRLIADASQPLSLVEILKQ